MNSACCLRGESGHKETSAYPLSSHLHSLPDVHSLTQLQTETEILFDSEADLW